MIENIKKLYAKVEDKQKFIEVVAEEFGKDPRTLQNHWFIRFFSVPDKYQARVVELLQNTLQNQIEQLSKLLS
ncbi:hypothetical protein [Aquimarina macrocephali]|uniref:hypothetical protein n=1 Tax=Aquimarina macrocephali TaxID=666563 RepID=UPI003F67277E